MRRFGWMSLLVLSACVVPAHVEVFEDEALSCKEGRVVVLDPFESGGSHEPGLLQVHLADALQRAGYPKAETMAVRRISTSWEPEAAAAAARERGACAAFTTEIRREEVSKEESRLLARGRLISAKEGRILYQAEWIAEAGAVSEEKLAEILTDPLGRPWSGTTDNTP